MNAMVNFKVMNWSKRSAKQWLEQYGLWVRSGTGKAVGVSANPLARLIDQNDIKRVRKSKTSKPCEIEDYEAVEVGKLLAKMHDDKREYLAERAWFIILHHECGLSYDKIAIAHGCSKKTVRDGISMGVAYLDGKIED